MMYHRGVMGFFNILMQMGNVFYILQVSPQMHYVF